ncbi:hypothetical protein ACFL96_16660 [Thermoproteota archaeon]
MKKRKKQHMLHEKSVNKGEAGQDLALIPSEHKHKFMSVFKTVLPYLSSDDVKIVLAQVLIALKIEGVLGKEVSVNQSLMVKVIKDALVMDEEKKKEAVNYARRLQKED